MARPTKNIRNKARLDIAQRQRDRLHKLERALEDAGTDAQRDIATAALGVFYAEQAQAIDQKNQLKGIKVALRAAKKEAKEELGETGPRIKWAPGGQELVPGKAYSNNQFSVAFEGNLAKCVRKISRWETNDPQNNVRGIKRGEIIMVISSNYLGYSQKQVVDVMVGPDIVRGIPAMALRPLE
jgi:hypothetical protein